MVEIAPLGALVVDIEARVDKLEKGIAKANAIQRRGAADMENRARQSAKKLEDSYASSATKIGATFEKMFDAFKVGTASLVGAGGLALGLKEVADSIAEVDREAQKAGVSAKVWQQWRYVATATGASIDGVTDALKELNIRGDEFARNGKGSGAEWFQRLGYTAEEVGRKLQDPNALLDELIGKIQKLDRAGQTRALDELFGGAGEQMAKTLGLSVAQIQKLRSEAKLYSDEQIEAAKKIDAEWETMWTNFTVRAKAAAIEGVSVAKKVIDAINAPYNRSRELSDRYNSPEEELKRLEAQRQSILAAIEREQAGDSVLKQAELRNLATQLKFVEERILALGGGSKQFKDTLKELSDASNSLTPALGNNTSAATNFKNALAELKALVPGLKTELDALAQSASLTTAYQNAARNARSMGELWQATDIANRARSVATYGQHNNMLDLIGAAEGTDRGRGYNETLGYGAYTGGAVNLTGMTLDQVMALQGRMLANPANTFNSSAVGRYQITRQTLQDAMRQMNLAGDRNFDEATQDEIARWILRSTGGNVDALRGRWTSLQRVDTSTISNAYNGTPTAAQPLDASPGQQRQTDLMKQQADARRNLNQAIQEGLDKARFEQSLSGLSESQKRVELELYDRLAQMKRDGVTLSDAEIQKLREKIAMTDQLNQKNQQVQTSTEGLRNAQQFFAEGFTQSLSGLLTGTTTLQQAVQNLLNSLIDATLQASLLGKGPLAGLFGGGTGLFGMLFGFSGGGYTGDGGKYQPKGIVHGGEFVVTKEATKHWGVANLSRLNSLKGYANGGLVGSPARLAPTSSERHAGALTAQAITINSPITVNATGGTPEQNADLARQIRRETEQSMRGLIQQEIFRQQRPGNILNR